MTNHTDRLQNPNSHTDLSQFWSSHPGLTRVTLSVAVIIFLVTPLREAGLPSRLFFDMVVVALMISGTLVIDQSRMAEEFAISVVLVSAIVATTGRLYPTPFLHLLGSASEGGACVYRLIGMVWASAFQFLEQLRPGSFHLASAPTDLDQLTSKLTYFSFATLTTVGCTIAPVRSLRSLLRLFARFPSP